MKKNSLKIILLGAALSAVTFTGLTRAADDTTTPPPAKPATPATQPRTNGRRGNFNPAEMLKNYRDQFEGLNLTDDQMKKIDGFLDTATAEATKAAASEDRDTRRGAYQAIQKLNEDVQSVLTDTQKTALRAKRTAMMFDRTKTTYTNPELKLTDDQTAKIGAIIDDAKKQAAALTPGTDAQDDRAKIFAIMKDAREKLNAVLTSDQQKQIPQRGFGGDRRRGGQGNAPASSTTTPPAPAK